MMVLSNILCKTCNYKCNSVYFRQKFIDWTSGNNDINKFIQDSQLSAHKDISNVLEWIPYDKFHNVKYITKAGMYRANWIDGYVKYWDNKNQNWKREGNNMFVNLKSLNTSNNLALEFTNKVL
jgi:hypothetical protein